MYIIAYFRSIGSLKFAIYELTTREDQDAAKAATSRCSELPFEEAMMKYCEEKDIRPLRSGMTRVEAVEAKRAMQKAKR